MPVNKKQIYVTISMLAMLSGSQAYALSEDTIRAACGMNLIQNYGFMTSTQGYCTTMVVAPGYVSPIPAQATAYVTLTNSAPRARQVNWVFNAVDLGVTGDISNKVREVCGQGLALNNLLQRPCRGDG